MPIWRSEFNTIQTCDQCKRQFQGALAYAQHYTYEDVEWQGEAPNRTKKGICGNAAQMQANGLIKRDGVYHSTTRELAR